jgi:hypothetical protein
MTKNLETTQSKAYFPRLEAWKWEKRHWLIVIGLSCLVLWYFAPSLKNMPWLTNAIGYLPMIGSLAFATDNLLKLTR